ncbi:MAG: NAD(P)-binding domain-containing protein [Gammaproteobacteria bacterium]|nr:NAD(P)-binding domain-containing protein [Gammaproteobacteria bacterium]
MNIGFLGCGLIAEPMVRSLCRNFPDARIALSKRSESTTRRLSKSFRNVSVGNNQWVLDRSEIVVLSLLAGVAREILPGLVFRDGQQVISVMADIGLPEVSELIAPAQHPCVTIPLPFIETGGCPLPVYPRSRILEVLFGQENTIIPQSSEEDMGPHFAATAILSVLMAQLDCTRRWLESKAGNPEDAEIYVASLVSGYLGSLQKDGKERFVEAMKDLSTKGGLNTQLLGHHQDAGLLEVLENGLDGLDRRLRGATRPG